MKLARRVVARYIERIGMEHESPEALKRYLKEHPGADKSKHHVKKKEDSGSKQESGSSDKSVDSVRKAVKSEGMKLHAQAQKAVRSLDLSSLKKLDRLSADDQKALGKKLLSDMDSARRAVGSNMTKVVKAIYNEMNAMSPSKDGDKIAELRKLAKKVSDAAKEDEKAFKKHFQAAQKSAEGMVRNESDMDAFVKNMKASQNALKGQLEGFLDAVQNLG